MEFSQLGVLTAVTDTVQAGAVATALDKCMKLSGSQTLTGRITLSSGNNYTFCGALPSEIGYLSTSSIQTQLNKCITSIPSNFTTLTLNGNTVATTNQLPSMSGYILTNTAASLSSLTLSSSSVDPQIRTLLK